MSKTRTLEVLIAISIIGDIAARLLGLGDDFALAVTQGALGIMLLADVYKEWRGNR